MIFNPFALWYPSHSQTLEKHYFIKNQNITQIKNTNHWIFSSQALETRKTSFCIWYWNHATSINLDEQQVVRVTKILVRNQLLIRFLIWACGCFIVFWVIRQWSMLHVTEWKYWLCLLMFMKNVITCCLDLCLFMVILSVVVIVSHSRPKLLLGFNFCVWMCLLIKQKQKQSRKYDPSDVCVESQKQKQKHTSVYSLCVCCLQFFNC